MRKTGIDLLHDESTITLFTTCPNEREKVLARLEERGASYRKIDYELNGEWDSTLFRISREDTRMPRKLIKAPNPHS